MCGRHGISGSARRAGFTVWSLDWRHRSSLTGTTTSLVLPAAAAWTRLVPTNFGTARLGCGLRLANHLMNRSTEIRVLGGSHREHSVDRCGHFGEVLPVGFGAERFGNVFRGEKTQRHEHRRELLIEL